MAIARAAPQSEFVLGSYALGLGMLALFGVVAVAAAGAVELEALLPFAVIPLALLIASASLFWRWAIRDGA